MQPEDYLKAILNSSTYFQLFYDYCKSRYCQENLDFWLAVQSYKKHGNKKKAIGIIDEFVGNRVGGEVVNLDERAIATLRGKRDEYIAARQNAKRMGFFKRHWSAGNRKAAEGLFGEAEAHVFNLILNDSYQKYSLTQQGKAVRQAIDKAVAKNGQRYQMLGQTGLI